MQITKSALSDLILGAISQYGASEEHASQVASHINESIATAAAEADRVRWQAAQKGGDPVAACMDLVSIAVPAAWRAGESIGLLSYGLVQRKPDIACETITQGGGVQCAIWSVVWAREAIATYKTLDGRLWGEYRVAERSCAGVRQGPGDGEGGLLGELRHLKQWFADLIESASHLREPCRCPGLAEIANHWRCPMNDSIRLTIEPAAIVTLLLFADPSAIVGEVRRFSEAALMDRDPANGRQPPNLDFEAFWDRMETVKAAWRLSRGSAGPEDETEARVAEVRSGFQRDRKSLKNLSNALNKIVSLSARDGNKQNQAGFFSEGTVFGFLKDAGVKGFSLEALAAAVRWWRAVDPKTGEPRYQSSKATQKLSVYRAAERLLQQPRALSSIQVCLGDRV